MKIEKVYMVAVKTDDKGNATEVLEVRNVKVDELNSLKNQVSEHLAEEQKLAEEQIKAEKLKDNKLYIKAVAIAKTLFNELVDSGKAKTTNEFEEMFDKFILGGSFDESIAPIKYLDILRRLK